MERSHSFSGYEPIKESLEQLRNSLGSSLDDLDDELHEKVVSQLRDIFDQVSSKKPVRRHSIGGLPLRRSERKTKSVQPSLRSVLSPLEEDNKFSDPLTGQVCQSSSTENILDDDVFEDSHVKDLKVLQDDQVFCSSDQLSDKDVLEDVGTLVKPESETHTNVLSYRVMPEHGTVYNIAQTELVVSKDLKLPSDILSILVIPSIQYNVFNHSLNSDLSM